MAVYRTRVIEQALLNKGMEQDDTHHHVYKKTVEGVTEIITRMSHGARTIDDRLGKAMAAQCCLQLKEFWNLVDCPMSEEEWDTLIKERGHGDRNPYLRSRR